MAEEKTSGLLIWANTSAYGYQLEIKSLNFTLDYETDYKYDVLKFNEPKEWYNLTGALDGNFKSNPTGLISINFTGDYVKDPNDLNNVFEDPIPWIDLAIIENNSGLLNTNFTLNNRSNGEVARELVLSFNNFLSGFRISLDNLSNIKALAIQQAGGVINGNVSILESNLTISFDFNSTYQNTTITYEKLSGLLLWSNTTKSNYLLEIAIRANNTLPYIAPGTGGPPLNPGDIVFLPYLIVIIASVAIVVPFEFTPRASSKTKKFVFIAMIAVSSFSALFFFNNNMDVLFPAQAEGKVDNITLIVDYGNTTIDTFGPFSLEGGNTYIINAVEKWCDTTMIGNFIDEINGYKPPDGWMYSVNEIYVGSVTSTALKSGDVIRFYPA